MTIAEGVTRGAGVNNGCPGARGVRDPGVFETCVLVSSQVSKVARPGAPGADRSESKTTLVQIVMLSEVEEA
jgi:hypothetical protein